MSIRFEDIVYGPVMSRRLGNSFGINLLPRHGKLCTFDCIYCECGWNKDGRSDSSLPEVEEVAEALESGLRRCFENGTPVDTITFSGNGEPTLHPRFAEIIDRTLALRDKYFPKARVAVLSNATRLSVSGIKEALARVDDPILKLDAASDDFARLVDRPRQPEYSVAAIEAQLMWFNGNFVLQTMFLKGRNGDVMIDSTDPENADAWRRMVLRLRPRKVMMYSLDRIPPLETLEKVSAEEMKTIAQPLADAGIDIMIKA